ncbi:DUF4167 domain-containing protein [Sphingomonas sp.]|uniref:DUF4167 domain-containing protein n=1 Tax=Sphingomonas sp. TaxID=28214 RepID=UPI002DBD5B8B|nr:DUF4167 domain-containing protein [Sphingomonas sp.]HEU4967328.1 DUF4167 domain-containing protein [Sphingomonas sp.]
MIDNRQSGRRRGRGGQRPQGNPGRPGGGGNRIDNRARGNAQQLHEKYKNLARDAQMAGDRVTTEYYLQFADHYFRVLSESRARFEEQRPQRTNSDEEFDGEDSGDEFEARDNNQRRERNDRGDRNGFRRDGERRERQNEQQPAEAAGEANEASEQPRSGEDDQRRNRRPRRQREDNEPAEAFDADRLPPSIAVDNEGSDEQPAPRRRGRRPRAESANDTVEVPPAA